MRLVAAGSRQGARGSLSMEVRGTRGCWCGVQGGAGLERWASLCAWWSWVAVEGGNRGLGGGVRWVVSVAIAWEAGAVE